MMSCAALRIAHFKNSSASHAHFVHSPRFLFVAGAGVPCLQQPKPNQKKKGKGKEGL